MPNKPAPHRSHCPVSFALDLFGDKWTLLIVRDLLFKDKRRYGEFLASEEQIATNVLADRLAKLEAARVIAREVDPAAGRHPVYRLTDKGLDLAPMLVEMILWSARYDPSTAADRSFVRRARSNRASLIAEVIASARSGR